jgi:hypothetical protein
MDISDEIEDDGFNFLTNFKFKLVTDTVSVEKNIFETKNIENGVVSSSKLESAITKSSSMEDNNGKKYIFDDIYMIIILIILIFNY